MTFKELYEYMGRALVVCPEIANTEVGFASEYGYSSAALTNNSELFAYKIGEVLGQKINYCWLLTNDDMPIESYKDYGYTILTKSDLQPRGFELKNCYICTKCGWMDSEKSKTCPCCGERLED